MNKTSAGKVQGNGRDKEERRYPKTDMRHWGPRLIRREYVREGKTYVDPFYSVQIQVNGRRESIVLDSPNQETAAGNARDIYKSILSNGWEATLAVWKPATERKRTPEERPTIGMFLEAARAVCPARGVSVLAYVQAFRRVASEVAGCPWSGKHKDLAAWRTEVDALALDTLTPDKVEEWKLTRVRAAGTEPAASRRVRITVNSLVRNSRALFSRSMLPLLRSRLVLPSPLPFEAVRLEKRQVMRYASTIDATAILTAAKNELAMKEPEPFKVLLLAVCCGLRVSEIDTLLWRSFDFDGRRLRVEANEFTALKSQDSAGDVDLDDELVALFRGYRARATSDFVVEGKGKPRNRNEKRGYRINTVWKRSLEWLRANGVNDPKPIHVLRKELGSLVNQKHGLVAAQRMLRHADIGTTASHYVGTKERLSVGLGALLAEEGNVIPMRQPAGKQVKKARRASA